MRKSDVGRAMWHVYMGVNGNGLLPDKYRRINGVVYMEKPKTFGELYMDRMYDNRGKRSSGEAEQRRKLEELGCESRGNSHGHEGGPAPVNPRPSWPPINWQDVGGRPSSKPSDDSIPGM